MIAGDLSRFVTAHPARPDATRLTHPPHPVDHRADAQPKAGCRRTARQTVNLDRAYRPLPQIHRIGSCHLRLASISSPILESKTQHVDKAKSLRCDSAKPHPALAPTGWAATRNSAVCAQIAAF